MMKTGDRIRELRKRKGLTQQDLATASGVSRVTLGFYERNKNTPPSDALGKIAEKLSVSTDYLLHGDNTPFMKENAVPPPDTDTMSPEEIVAMREKNERAVKRHIQIAEEREGFMRAYDCLNDMGKGKIHGYMVDLVEQPKYLKSGVKPLVREDAKE